MALDVVNFDKELQLDINDDVFDIIAERLHNLHTGIMTLLITYFVCIPLGIAKAIKHNTPLIT